MTDNESAPRPLYRFGPLTKEGDWPFPDPIAELMGYQNCDDLTMERVRELVGEIRAQALQDASTLCLAAARENRGEVGDALEEVAKRIREL